MPNTVKPKHHLTQTEKDRAVFLTSQGVEPLEIGRELGVDARQISGFIRSQINMGKIPAPPSKTLPPSLEMPMAPPLDPQQSFQPPQFQGPSAPSFAPTPIPAPVQQSPPPQAYQPAQDHAPQSDGWVDGRVVFGHSDGFTNKAQQVRTVVEREIPADGIMGEHSGSITPTQICEIYGEGVYKILRYEPGRSVPMEYKVRASAAYGPSRTPKRSSSPDPARPGGFQRAWGGWRGQAQGMDEEGHHPQRPYPNFQRQDPGLDSFARHSSPMGDAAAAATTEAIKLMGRSQEQMIEQISRSRENGPENFMKELLQQQTANMDAKLTEEGRRRDQERKDEESRWERRQTELDKAHQREIERIKADSESRAKAAADERKMLVDIEERKLQIIREEHKNREETFRDELKRNRDELKETLGRAEKEIKETREAMGAQISESDERFQKRFEEHQAALEREHQLKEKNLETAEKFQTQVFELKREAIQSAGGDQLFQTINTVIKEFSKGLEKIVDLKKIEALTPEAQAAAVAKGTIDGNVMGGESRRQAQEQAATPHSQASGATTTLPAGSAASEPAGETKTKEQEMEQVIRDNLDRPIAREIIKEWANQVKRENNPATFANTYMEWMRDPIDHEGRKATTMFANFMAGHDWAEILAIMAPKLDKETVAIFRSAFAEDYYNGFRGMVTEQIRQYWEDFLTERQTKRAALSAAGDAVPASDVSQRVKG